MDGTYFRWIIHGLVQAIGKKVELILDLNNRRLEK
jgi:hypothetical protein